MRANNQLVLEPIGSLQKIVQMHVPELVYLLAPMVRTNEAHLGNENLCIINGRILVEPAWTRVPRVGQDGSAHLARNLHAGQAQVADFLARQAKVLLLELV